MTLSSQFTISIVPGGKSCRNPTNLVIDRFAMNVDETQEFQSTPTKSTANVDQSDRVQSESAESKKSAPVTPESQTSGVAETTEPPSSSISYGKGTLACVNRSLHSIAHNDEHAPVIDSPSLVQANWSSTELMAATMELPARADSTFPDLKSSEKTQPEDTSVGSRIRRTIVSGAQAGGKMVDQAMGLVSGVHDSQSKETQNLLHQRLKITTLLLFAGFEVFLFANVVFGDGCTTTMDHVLLWSRIFMTTLTGLLSWRLWANCPHVFGNLRLVELVVFGGAAWIFLLMSYSLLEEGARQDHMATIIGPWQLLIFTYALFIPNTWRRALAVIAPLALSPVAVAVVASYVSPEVHRFAQASNQFQQGLIQLSMVTTFMTVVATFGVFTIGSLRNEAFTARRLGQYRLSRLLGSGGMGDVYIGEHVLLKRPCAIKVIKPEKASDPKMLERFEREVRSTARLTHWNTVAIYDYGRSDDGTFFYVMEYLPGLNLNQVVHMFGPLSPSRTIHLLDQICDALMEAHQEGMIHRDIKPANIFASKRGNNYDVAKLLDFGLVRRAFVRDEESTGDSSIDPGADAGVIGSPLFMSPEQAAGHKMDHRTDIYSIGITSYYLLTGHAPFEHKDPMQILRAHRNDTPPPFSKFVAGVPADLEAVVRKCMEKRPEDRYDNIASLKKALSKCDSAGLWTWGHAAKWWKLHRCPEKSAVDAAVENGRLAELDQTVQLSMVES